MDSNRTVAITCPLDAIAAVPYLIGFHPQNSLVLLASCKQGTFALRVDLMESSEEYGDFLHRLDGILIRHRADAVLLVGYGVRDRAVPMLTAVQGALDGVVTIKEVLHVNGGRWRSLMCADPSCCPPDGTPYDISTSAVAAQSFYTGMSPFDSREDLAATLAPIEGEDRTWMEAETQRAEAELLRDGPIAERLRDEGVPLVRDLIGQDRRLTDREVARLSIVLCHLRVRDEAWTRIADLNPHQQLMLWSDLTRRAIGEYAAAPAVLLAYTAYIHGNGALAAMALDRCLEVRPGYTLADLLAGCLNYGVAPSVVRDSLTYTSAELAREDGETIGD